MDLSKNLIKLGKSKNSDRITDYKNCNVLFVIKMNDEEANYFEEVQKSYIPEEYKFRSEYYYIFNHSIEICRENSEITKEFIYTVFESFTKKYTILEKNIIYLDDSLNEVRALFKDIDEKFKIDLENDIDKVKKDIEIQILKDEYEVKKKQAELDNKLYEENKKKQADIINKSLEKLYDKLLDCTEENDINRILSLIEKLELKR